MRELISGRDVPCKHKALHRKHVKSIQGDSREVSQQRDLNEQRGGSREVRSAGTAGWRPLSEPWLLPRMLGAPGRF